MHAIRIQCTLFVSNARYSYPMHAILIQCTLFLSLRPPQATFEQKMSTQQTAEIHRVALDGLALQVLVLGLATGGPGGTARFLNKALDPPSADAIENALQELRQIGAIDEEEELLPLGYHLAALPVNARLAKLLIFGCVLRCIEPVLSIAATLGGRSPFRNMQNVDDEDEREEVARNRAKLSANCPSDHIIGAKAVQQWLDASNKSQFCKSLGLSFDAMRSIKQQRDAFARDLAGLGFVSRGGGGGGRGDLNANGNSDRVVSAVRKRLLLGRCNATIVTNSALVYNYPPGFVCGAVQERGSSMEADTEVRGDIWGDGRGEGRGEGIAVLPVASGGYGWCTEQAVQVRSGDRAGDQQALQR
jgi:hypothetical protein